MRNNNLENGMLLYKDREDEELTAEEIAEGWEKEPVSCYCNECKKAIHRNDNCYRITKTIIICEECIDFMAVFGKDVEEEMKVEARQKKAS